MAIPGGPTSLLDQVQHIWRALLQLVLKIEVRLGHQPENHLHARRAQDYLLVLGTAIVLLPMLRILLHYLAFQPLARSLLLSSTQKATGTVPDKVKADINKFCESAWKLCVYTTTFSLGIYAVYDAPWLRDTAEYWYGWPRQDFSPKLLLLYKASFSTYLSFLLMHVTWETRRRDFYAMFGHHVATVGLIALSFYLGFLRVGSVIMVLHDASDVLLESAKLLNYQRMETASTAIFVLFMLSWLLLRLVYFPFWVVWSTMFQIEDVLGYKPSLYPTFNALLLLLVVLHIYWFWLICKVAARKVMYGRTEDVREED